jgi:hypothetical protein
MKAIKNRKKRIFAIPAAANATAPKPNNPATIATTRKTSAQYSIRTSFPDKPMDAAVKSDGGIVVLFALGFAGPDIKPSRANGSF